MLPAVLWSLLLLPAAIVAQENSTDVFFPDANHVSSNDTRTTLAAASAATAADITIPPLDQFSWPDVCSKPISWSKFRSDFRNTGQSFYRGPQTLSAATQFSRGDFNVFEGRHVRGIPTHTISAGRLVFCQGDLRAQAGAGNYVKRPPFTAVFEALDKQSAHSLSE